jgi:hypothetical protein
MEDKPEEGEAYDSDFEGRTVRLANGRTGVVIGRACSCYRPYEVLMDDTGDDYALSCIDFEVIEEIARAVPPKEDLPWL